MYWLYDTIKFLVLVALAVLALKKFAEAIRSKKLTWDTVGNFFSGLRSTLHRLKEEANRQAQEDHQSAQAAVLENAEKMDFSGEETVLIVGKNYDLMLFYVIFYILLSLCILCIGLTSGEFGLTVASLFIAALIVWLFYALENYLHSLRKLVVTNKRVYFRFLSHQVDLPLDFITAVGTGFYMFIKVSSPSGVIRIPWIENYREIHETVVALLLKRQTPPAQESSKSESAVPAAAEEAVAQPPQEPESPAEPEPIELPAPEPEIPVTESVTEEVPAEPVQPFVTDKRYPEDETDWFAPPVRQESRLADQGMRIGRCVMCRRIELPVKTVPVMLAGVERKRTLCERCAERHGIKNGSTP